MTTEVGKETFSRRVIRLYPPPPAEMTLREAFPVRGRSAGSVGGRVGGDRPLVSVNTVSTVDGRASVDGKAGGIGGDADRELMRRLRASADAVVVGAGTLRAERLSLSVPEELREERLSKGLGAMPLAVVVTSSGEVPIPENLIGAPPQEILVFSPEDVASGLRSRLPEGARVEPVNRADRDRDGAGGTAGLDLREVLSSLYHRHGVGEVIVEGGPSLNNALLALDVVDEFFLTIAPKILGGTLETTIAQGPQVYAPGEATGPRSTGVAWRLEHSYLSESGELFLKYARDRYA